MQVDQRSRVRQITFLVPSTEELTRRRRDWYTDRKTTELIWCWPEVNRKLSNSFEYTSNSLELSWIHFESFGITWNNWNLLKILELDLNYLEYWLQRLWNFICYKKYRGMDGNFCEFEQRVFELFRILLCSKKITPVVQKNLWKSFEHFGINWEILKLF